MDILLIDLEENKKEQIKKQNNYACNLMLVLLEV